MPKSPSQSDKADEPAGKPDSVITAEAVTGDHPTATAVASGLVRSTRELGRAALERSRRRTFVRPFDLAPGGVYRAVPVTWVAGGLLHRRFTLAPSKVSGAVCFLWHCPAGHPGWVLPTTMLFGVRTFLNGACTPPRSPGRLVRRDHKPSAPARHSRNEGVRRLFALCARGNRRSVRARNVHVRS